MNLTGLKEVLEAREVRVERQCGLLSSGGVLVSFSLNIPGPAKNTVLYQMVFEEGLRLLENMPELRGIQPETGKNAAGPFAFFLIHGGEARAQELKRSVMALEEGADPGRLFDIDVLYKGREGLPVKVSRTELGMPARQCLVCVNPAFTCVRAGRHRVPEVLMRAADRILGSEEIVKRIFGICEMTAAEKIALEALRAILYEVITTPKPGLVDTENNGAHSDMDIAAFFDSAVAIAPYFRDCVQTGMEYSSGPAEMLLPRLRPLGLEAEAEMYRATGGVNTHKGAIFTMGLLCAAAGMIQVGKTGKEMQTETEIPLLAGRIASSMDNGSAGIRYEAMNGYPSLREALRAYNTAETRNTAGVRTLLTLMSQLNDANIVRRAGEDRAEWVRCKAGYIAEQAFNEKDLLAAAADLDAELIRRNISPGGSADLLAAVYFLQLINPLLKKEKSSKIQ